MKNPTFLTGVTNPAIEAQLVGHPRVGLLAQPGSYAAATVARWPVWAADNGCFTESSFDPDRWLAWLASFPDELRSRCLWATAPDRVGDAFDTFLRSLNYLDRIKGLGYRAAFVAQDGAEKNPDWVIPWDRTDVLFLGGSTEWKLSHYGGGRLAFEAHRRGVPVHMGRVNSKRRLNIADFFGCETVDGTFLAYGPTKNLPTLLGWLADDDVVKAA